MARTLIEANGLGKAYRIYERPSEHLMGLIPGFGGRRRADFWALRQVSFSVGRGESWGFVGENGAGKSTLLKLVAGVTRPTEGTLTVEGRVGALLELGAGFHPEYTGRQNAILAAGIMGLGKREIEERMGAIIEFAELGDFIDRPVKTYSTGMYMRLAFSVATAVDPQVLITDEVLAVGDEPFQKKCIRRMEDFLGKGGTLLFCSHSMYHVKKICQKAMWLERGRARMVGDATLVADQYEDYLRAKDAAGVREEKTRPPSLPEGYNRIVRGEIRGGDRAARDTFEMGERVCVRIEVETPSASEPTPVVAIGLVRNDGTAIYGVFSDADGVRPARVGERRYAIEYALEELSLLPGSYSFRLHALDGSGLRLFDTVEIPFKVVGQSRELGICRLAHRWQLPT